VSHVLLIASPAIKPSVFYATQLINSTKEHAKRVVPLEPTAFMVNVEPAPSTVLSATATAAVIAIPATNYKTISAIVCVLTLSQSLIAQPALAMPIAVLLA